MPEVLFEQMPILSVARHSRIDAIGSGNVPASGEACRSIAAHSCGLQPHTIWVRPVRSSQGPGFHSGDIGRCEAWRMSVPSWR